MNVTKRHTIAALILAASVGLASPAWAGGRTDEEAFEPVSGTGNWEHTIDVTDRPPGRYNIIVRARDEAGNEALGGPYNIYLDPDSDRPRTTVSFPTPGQRVGQRLFVVGTARDDEAVSYVEVQVNDGPFTRASGSEYWSLLLPMTNLPDGTHTLSARAVDVNGTAGDPVSVPFLLDTQRPVIATLSHQSGVFVSRRTTVEGAVRDANGIAWVRLIADGREQTLRLRTTKDESLFSFEIDPRGMDEGPTVYWIESMDLAGSVGSMPFLFYVDTSPPELEVLYPTATDRVDAQLRFVGRVGDAVGVKSLTYELSSGQSGEIPLVPGDPYWGLEVDLPPGSRGNLTATFRATDFAGNERVERVRYQLDDRGDLPVVNVLTPVDGAVVERAVLAGHVFDDDGAAAVIYSVDGGPPARVELQPGMPAGFVVDLPGLAPGPHEVRIRGVDIHGLEGGEVRRRFTVATPLPLLSLTSVARAESTEEYLPGFTVAANERVSLVGLATPGTDGRLPERVEYTAGASTGRAAVGADGSFTLPLPRTATGGIVRVQVVATNEAGRSARFAGFYVQLPAGTESSGVAGYLQRGLYLAPDQTGSEPEGETAPWTLPSGSVLRLLAVGGTPAEVRLSEETDFLTVTTAGPYVVLRATRSGAVRGVRVTARVGGATVSSPPLSITTGTAPPLLAAPEGVAGSTLSGPVEFSITASDPTGITRLTAIVRTLEPGVPAASVTAAEPPAEGRRHYTAAPPLPGVEGPAVIEIEAEAGSGYRTVVSVPITVLRTAPELRILTPQPDDTVNGTITVYALLKGARAVELVEAIDPASEEESSVSLGAGRLVTHRMSTSAERNTLLLRVTDIAGNTAETRVRLRVDEEADRPRLQVQVPQEGALIEQEFRLSGVLLDDDAPASITYRVNEGPEVTVPTGGVFDIRVPMEGLQDGEHTIAVFGSDIGGARSDTIIRNVSISRTEPVSTVAWPPIDSFQRGIITIEGSSEDPNGIEAVFVSTDNGASFQRADGAEEWTYRLDTGLLSDGTHSLLVRAVDRAGAVGMLATTLNVDNTPPVLELVEPEDGVSVSGPLLIDGRGEDSALREIRLVAQALATAEEDSRPGAPMELARFSEPGPFAYLVDTSTLAPGWYNLRVEAEDRAGNTRRISRNLRVEPADVAAAPEIVVPADGERVAHRFQVTVLSPPSAGPVTLLASNRPVAVIPIGGNGTGTVVIEPGMLPPGAHALVARTEQAEGQPPLASGPRTITYAARGPWIEVDAPGFLSFVRDRPFLTGTAGYELVLPDGDDRETERRRQELRSAHRVERVEVSLDNGRTFRPARGTESWQYRLETTELPDGRHNLVIRVRYASGEAVVVRHAVVVDEQPPIVRLLSPRERDTFHGSVRIVGVTTDENMLGDVSVALRPGDKARYEVPSFVQGLYLDAHVLGATYFDVGAGLTFFDNNVRIQAQVGLAPPGRFSGLVLGTKLLANVASVPASYLLGPDFAWLSAALALGANFSYFTMSEDQIAFTPDGLVLAGMVAQLEFPIVRIDALRMFNTYALYTEAQLWFISSDVEAGTAFRLSFGVRADVF